MIKWAGQWNACSCPPAHFSSRIKKLFFFYIATSGVTKISSTTHLRLCVRVSVGMGVAVHGMGSEYLVRHRHQLILVGVLVQGARMDAVSQLIFLIGLCLLFDKTARSFGYISLYLSRPLSFSVCVFACESVSLCTSLASWKQTKRNALGELLRLICVSGPVKSRYINIYIYMQKHINHLYIHTYSDRSQISFRYSRLLSNMFLNCQIIQFEFRLIYQGCNTNKQIITDSIQIRTLFQVPEYSFQNESWL